ncbi:MAG: S9 family peptidase [Gemmatimonadetes bacterium]|nr:S9 family peptidase [Gemmatimonadota bacterium]
MLLPFRSFGIVLGLLATAVSVGAQRPNTTREARSFRDLSLTPDGTMLAWIGPRDPADAPGVNVVAVAGGTARRVVVPAVRGTERDLAWSPDGTRLALLAESGGRPALYVMTRASGAVRQVAWLRGNTAGLRWSPDGRTIALLNTENPTRPSGPLAPQARDTGLIGRQFDAQRIAAVDLTTGVVRQISRPDLYVHEFAWSPDGSRFLAAAAPGPGDSGWYTDEIWIMDATGSGARSLGKPGMQIASPRWSPDGSRIAYVGGLMSDEGVPGGDVYLVDAAGGVPRNLTPGIQISPNWLAWTAGPNRIVFTAWADGGSAIGTVDPGTGETKLLWQAGESIHAVAGVGVGGLALSRDGAVSGLIRHSFERPPEVWAGPIGQWKQVTRVNDGLEPVLGQSANLHWTSDALTIQGWLLHPKNADPSRRHPMVVIVHGGPASAHQPRWLSSATTTERSLLEAGYYVFLPNPRGSQGFGQAFTRANVKDFGYGDLRDILLGVDAAGLRAPIDTARVGITGWSYGGYMTMWAVTQTRRFKAAVAGAGIANWLSYWAQNGINEWLLGYFGAAVYDDSEVYARSAPMTFIKQAKTPTLILVGEGDIETPAAQSYEFWKGLQHNGVETEFMIYPGEGHGIRNPVHIQDRITRSLSWFNRHLKPTPLP